MDKRFDIILLDEAKDFLKSLDDQTKKAIASDLAAATYCINSSLFKKLKGSDLWEFRTRYHGLQYRLLAFWDKERNSMVVVTHGFIKKTQKTPLQEIKKAESIMKHYKGK